jgi:hypothetical protein
MSGLSAERIQEIRERVEKFAQDCDCEPEEFVPCQNCIDIEEAGNSLRFHALSDIPDLLDEIEKYRQCLSDLRNQLCMCSAPDNKPCHWCGVIDAALKENEIAAAQPIQQGEGK